MSLGGSSARPISASRVQRRRSKRPDGPSEAVKQRRKLTYVYMYACIQMTTIRLTSTEKRMLRKAQEILEKRSARKWSQGEVVAALAEFALRHRILLAQASEEVKPVSEDDPFYDLSITFDIGATDERTHDRVLYGRP